MNKSIRVFIVDDNRLLREGLVSMLAEQEDFSVVGSAVNGRMALAHVKDLHPQVALIDIGLPDKDGIEVTQMLRRDFPEVKVIILGMPDLTDEIMACIEAGAVGYVLKEDSFDHLVETIRSATRVAELAGERIPRSSLQLTPREVDVINQIAQGLSNKEIAQQLSIEVQTVKNHIHNILDKLQLHNRLEAVQYARERNLLREK